jgi:hypothetical protein
MATANDQLAAALKAADEANAKVEKLKKQSRDADLETVRSLIKTHGFGPTDLRGVLKAKRKRSANKTTTAAKKTTVTPRKSTAAKKKK